MGDYSGLAMNIAVGSDERTPVTDSVVDHLRRAGIDVECQQGVLFCWTGTGVSIAANKVPGIRAALCGDAQTARGARKWNDANVLVMSLRATPEAVAKEICDAWLETGPDEAERATIAKVESPHPALPRKQGRED